MVSENVFKFTLTFSSAVVFAATGAIKSSRLHSDKNPSKPLRCHGIKSGI